LTIYSAFLLIYVEQPHYISSALYKYPKIAVKTNSKDQQTLVNLNSG